MQLHFEQEKPKAEIKAYLNREYDAHPLDNVRLHLVPRGVTPNCGRHWTGLRQFQCYHHPSTYWIRQDALDLARSFAEGSTGWGQNATG